MLLGVITGVTGQDGSYLAELLLEKGYTVWGLVRPSALDRFARIESVIHHPNFSTKLCDLRDTPSIQTVFSDFEKLEGLERVEIYNLAAQSNVKMSFDLPEYTADVDALGVLRFVECMRRSPVKQKIRFYQASTSELFGNRPNGPLNEESGFHPCSPYSVSKSLPIGLFAITVKGMDFLPVMVALFNHESPRRGAEFVTRKITLGIGKILKGQQESIELGNLNAMRDWGHARDFVEGMWRILQADTPQDWVLATGESHSVREFVETAFEVANMPIEWKGEGVNEEGLEKSTGKVRIRINPAFFRPNELHILQGDSTRALQELGWVHKTSFPDLVREMVKNDL